MEKICFLFSSNMRSAGAWVWRRECMANPPELCGAGWGQHWPVSTVNTDSVMSVEKQKSESAPSFLCFLSVSSWLSCCPQALCRRSSTAELDAGENQSSALHFWPGSSAFSVQGILRCSSSSLSCTEGSPGASLRGWAQILLKLSL